MNNNDKIKELEGIGFITSFLSIVHPNLDPHNAKDNKAGVEIRPIQRREKDEEVNYKLNKSHVFWQLDTRGTEYLTTFVNNVRNSENHFCLNYSVWTFDREMNSKTQSGKSASKNRINKSNALYTQEIAIDLDGLTDAEKNRMVYDLKNIGLSGLWVSTGHGYHLHLLLKEKLYDAEVVPMIVYLMLAKGFSKVDAKCIDTARVFRLPGTLNNKCFEADSKYKDERANPPKCEVTDWCWDRYSVEDIIEALNKIPTFDEDWYASYIKVCNTHQQIINKRVEAEIIKEETNGKTKDIDIDFTEEDVAPIKKEELPKDAEIYLKDLNYPYVNLKTLSFEPVKKILTKTEEGYRNNALGFLVWLFKLKYSFSKSQIFEIVSIWAKEACVPEYQNVKYDFERFYASNGLSYSTELAKKFGYIDFDDNEINRYRVDDQITIPSSMLEDFTKFEGNGFYIYLAVKIAEKRTENPLFEDIQKYIKSNPKTLRAAINDAIKAGVIYKRRNSDRKNVYHTHKILKPSDGFVKFNESTIKLILRDLIKTEGQLYLHLKYCSGPWGCIKSQENLANVCGVSKSMISKAVKSLEKKDFINVERTKITSSCIVKCTYVLLA